MTAELLKPQLVMCRPHLRELPPLALPKGHHLRHYRAGDARAWARIICKSFDLPFEHDKFEKQIRSRSEFRPERVLFITRWWRPVATATAWERARFGLSAGYVHMVGVLPGHRGKQLGFWVSLGVLHRFAAEGKARAVLETDDFRLPAIKTYLNLGFEPLLVDENQRQRWRQVFAHLEDGDAWRRRFKAIVAGPLHQFT